MKVIYRSHAERVIREEIKDWQSEKKISGRHSSGWNRADAAVFALRFALRRIKKLEAINARLA